MFLFTQVGQFDSQSCRVNDGLRQSFSSRTHKSLYFPDKAKKLAIHSRNTAAATRMFTSADRSSYGDAILIHGRLLQGSSARQPASALLTQLILIGGALNDTENRPQ